MKNSKRGLLKNNKGFTLIELIMVIVILGILAAVAIPKYVSMKSEAVDASGKGISAGLRGAISVLYAKKVLDGDDAAYTMGNVFDSAQISGVEAGVVDDTKCTAIIGGEDHTWTLYGVKLPDDAGTIGADITTW